MTPAILALLEAAITEVPELYTTIKTLFAGDTPPTPAQWAALQAKVAAENFNG